MVFAQARDPNTAITHSKKGKELQIYFAKNNQEEQKSTLLETSSAKVSTTQIYKEEKKDVNTWFKYGTQSTIKETSIKNTTFGMSLNKLLEETGIDISNFQKLKKDSNF